MKIGYLDESYPNARCIIGKTKNAYVKLVPNKWYKINKFKNRLKNYFFRKLNLNYKEWDVLSYINDYWYSNINSVDLLHVFNYIPITDKDWVATFESNIPVTNSTIGRLWEQNINIRIDDKLSNELLKRCSMDNCKGLIAISKSAYDIELSTIDKSNLDIETKSKIKQKLYIVHPPQNQIITKEELNKKINMSKKTIRFIIIGHDFFRKGGKQIINVLERLSKDNYKFELTIISKLIYGDYASLTDKLDYDYVVKKIEKYSWINYYSRLDNSDVLEIAKNSDVGLLPSLAETYGYSALELMACGCPVVTTNIRAFNEINNESRGWVCDLEPNKYGEKIYANLSPDQKKKILSKLENNLYNILKNILDNPNQINNKAFESYEYIKNRHSISKYEEVLNQIYSK